jgi:hypothetical protein
MNRTTDGRRARATSLWALGFAAWVIAGCAAGSPASGAPSNLAPSNGVPSGEELPMFSQQPPGKPSQMPPMRDPIDVVGVVEVGVEPGCIVLRTESGLYQLSGSTDPLIQPGARLRVLGRALTDVVTTCQQGTLLQVLEVHAAE